MSDDIPVAPRHWPPDGAFGDDEALALLCSACATPWRVHARLAGFRLRCSCGAWLEVPRARSEGPLPPAPAAMPRLPARRRANREPGAERIDMHGEPDLMEFGPLPLDAPMAPGSLLNQSPTNRARWTNRTVLECVALLAAMLGPQLVAFWLARGTEFELLLPFAAVVSGILVTAVIAAMGPYGRLGLHVGPPRHYGEAILGAGVALLAAIGWLRLLGHEGPGVIQQLTSRLGLGPAVFVVAVAPAVLEELVFRGVLQGRLLALLGARAGLVTTAIGFALCHGQPAVLPIHFAGGLWLGWLRQRAGTLLPGMLAHFLYNGAIVVFAIG